MIGITDAIWSIRSMTLIYKSQDTRVKFCRMRNIHFELSGYEQFICHIFYRNVSLLLLST